MRTFEHSIKYINKANPTSVIVAKKIFRWKFKPIPKNNQVYFLHV